VPRRTENVVLGKLRAVLGPRETQENQIIFNPMNLTTALRTRLAGRSDGEHEQAIMRVLIFALGACAYGGHYFSGNVATGRGHGGQNHTVDRDSLAALYHKQYGHHLW
jgi:hypothetical protein